MDSGPVSSIVASSGEDFGLDINLNDLQWLIINCAAQRQTYQQIADQSGYDHDYIKHVAADLWHSLSSITGETVSKHNFQSVLGRYQRSQSTLASDSQRISAIPSNLTYPSQVLIEAQEIRWVGRQSLIGELSQKILADCRILSLVGITGIGKSSCKRKYHVLESCLRISFLIRDIYACPVV